MRTKQEKLEVKLEGARLRRDYLKRDSWTDETIGACEALASRIIGHTQGCRSDTFRSSPAVCELPASHLGDYSAQSPINYMIP